MRDNLSVSDRFFFLIPEGKPRWSDSLLPWLLPAAIFVGALLFLLLYRIPPKHLALPGKQERYKTFQIMPEPARPLAPSRPSKPQTAQPQRAHPVPVPRPPVAQSRPLPHPQPRQSHRPAPIRALAPSREQRAPSTPPAATQTAPTSRPHIDIGRLEGQISDAARAATAAPELPKFHNPETPAADFYIAGWIQKLERIGDLNYPGELVGNLKVKVVLNPQGGLQRIIMVHSSGNPELDAAAEQIIRLSFPYTPFSDQLKKQTRRIEIPLDMHFLGVRRVNVWQ